MISLLLCSIMLPRLMQDNLREQLGSVLEPLLTVGKKAHPDWENVCRVRSADRPSPIMLC